MQVKSSSFLDAPTYCSCIHTYIHPRMPVQRSAERGREKKKRPQDFRVRPDDRNRNRDRSARRSRSRARGPEPRYLGPDKFSRETDVKSKVMSSFRRVARFRKIHYVLDGLGYKRTLIDLIG